MTPNGIIAAALARTGLSSSNSTHKAQGRLYLNMELSDLTALTSWAWLYKATTFATVASTATYSLAADVLEPFGFRDTTSDRPLVWRPASYLDDSDPDSSESGSPCEVALAGTDASGYWQVQLAPVPDDAYTIAYRYYAFLADLTAADDDVSLDASVPPWIQPALVHGVAALYLREKGDDGTADTEEGRRDRLVQRALQRNKPAGQSTYRFGGDDFRRLINSSPDVTVV